MRDSAAQVIIIIIAIKHNLWKRWKM